MTANMESSLIIRNVRRAYVANVITQFGTSLAFIPLGEYLGNRFGMGEGFAILLILMSIPAVILARPYAWLATRFSAPTVIQVSETLACLATLGAFAFYKLGVFYGFVLCVGLSFCASGALTALFPSILNLIAANDSHAQNHFSRWFISRQAVLIVSRVVGGYLQPVLDLSVFLLLDAVTYLSAFAIWRTLKFPSIPIEPPGEIVKTTRWFHFANLVNILRGAAYGIMNPMLAFMTLQRLSGTSAQLGNLYLALGLTSIVGAQVVSRIPATSTLLLLGLLGEFTLMLLGFSSSSFPAFLILMSLGVAIMPISEVVVQTLFLRSGSRSESHNLSTTFYASQNLANLVGYAAYALLGKAASMGEICVVLGALGGMSAVVTVVKRGRDK
jgi:hypothetical protein